MDPSHIPIAYIYREGKYLAHVNIFILNWRLWDDGDFPPLDNPPSPGQIQSQQQGHAGWESPSHFSSHSSSSATPSEPTIDLSFWSLRSYRMASKTIQIWTPKIKTNLCTQAKRGENTDLALEASNNRPSLVLNGRSSLRLTLYGSHLVPATKNQIQSSDTLGYTSTNSPIHLDSLLIPSPIQINFPPFLTQVSQAYNLILPQSSIEVLIGKMYYLLVLSCFLQEIGALKGLSLFVPPDSSLRKTLEIYAIVNGKKLGSPIQPKRNKFCFPKAHLLISFLSHFCHTLNPDVLPQPITPPRCTLVEIQEEEHNEISKFSLPSPTNSLLDTIPNKPNPIPKNTNNEANNSIQYYKLT